MDSTREELAVAAIDFGTTYSGYAFSFTSEYRKDPTKISCNTQWTTGSHQFGSMKTPTTILLKWNARKRDFEKVDFGYDAQNRYSILVEEGRHQDHVLVDRFKMKLYSESPASGLRRNTKIELQNGEEIEAIRLISMFIEYLKDHFFESLKKSNITLKVSDIRWVLSVPAIWTEGAKQMMREAAEMAGIPASKLTVAYEPEAAALSCLHLSDPTKTQPQSMLHKGKKYLVIDAGGGTVDFTVLEVTDTEVIEIKQEASGGAWGGVVVDENFMEIIKGIIGPKVFKKFEEKHPEDLVELYREFEIKKRNLKNDREQGRKKVTIKFPLSIGEIYEEMKGQSIENAFSTKYDTDIQIKKDKLTMDIEMMSSLFIGPCENIVTHTKELKKKSNGVDAILLVGGFGSADRVQQSLKKNFDNVIIPTNPELSVLMGAVHYGQNPLMVESRIARFTYGTETCKNFIEGQHPASKRRVYEGKAKCIDVFDVHVTKGQVVKIGDPESRKSYSPVSPEQTFMKFEIYASTEKNPEYVTDDSCNLIGEIDINLQGIGLDRAVIAEMSFGETELVVRATEKKTGKSVSTALNFLH